MKRCAAGPAADIGTFSARPGTGFMIATSTKDPFGSAASIARLIDGVPVLRSAKIASVRSDGAALPLGLRARGTKAGGDGAVPGDYLMRDYAPNGTLSGMWGLFRVH